MTMMCLAVMFVFSGTCWEQPYNTMPIVATAYNWEMGGVNCDLDCGVTAIGVETSPHLVGVLAACPERWVTLYHTTILHLPVGTFWCVDNFGSVANRRPVYHRGEWVLRVDVSHHNPTNFGVRYYPQWETSTGSVDVLE